jgi:hypothetical protein
MFKKEINAKEIYVFAEQCIEVQKANIKLAEEEIKNLEREIKKIKNPDEKKKAIARKNKTVMFKKEADEKIEYLINTLSIIMGVYEKNGKKFEIKPKMYQKLRNKYNFLEQNNDEKK